MIWAYFVGRFPLGRRIALRRCGRGAFLWLAFGFLALTARAHDPYQAWTSAIVRDDHLELTVTMAASTAARLIEPEPKSAPFTRENFSAHRARATATGPKLCVLTAAKEVLASRKVEVVYSEEDDVIFKIIYPRPAPGKLQLHSVFLEKLGDGYGSILEVADTSGNHLGWDQLTADSSILEVTVPAKPAAKKS